MNDSKENSRNLSEKTPHWPATLYVEGQDQFRGWFNSSLITSTILTGQTPYKQVLSHGFVVDEKGHKMSKSLGNVIDPEEIIVQFGVDILRLWIISSDFSKEIKVSRSILANLQENYQKIRNTFRFLLSNLYHLPPEWKSENDLEQELGLIDYYVLSQLEKLIIESQKSYREYNFNPIYTSLLSFCSNDLSRFYFEINKDSLYCDSLNSLRRKQAITTLYYLLRGLLKIVSPILPFLTEEVYQNIPFRFGFASLESIHLVNHPNSKFPSNNEKSLAIITDFFLPLRQDAYQTLEKARQEKVIDTNSQAHLKILLKGEISLDYSELNLSELLLVAEVDIEKKSESEERNLPAFKFTIQENEQWVLIVVKTDKEKCIRCWNYRDLANNLCLRCKDIL